MKNEAVIRREIAAKIKRIFNKRKKSKKFIPGKTWIQYGGGFFDEKEINASVNSLLDGWFGLGKKGREMETKLAAFIGAKGSLLTNSGSSANLLIVGAIMSPFFFNHLKPGDEVITAACGFPTTINPLVFYHLKPVFVDVDPQTYNLKTADLNKAYSKKTRAVLIAHTLGNPNQMDEIVEFCQKKKLLLLEDNCDALGSEYDNKKTGSFGLMASQSFYPPHHLTMGEGGAVLYNDQLFERIVRSLRDWGRACWCQGDEKKTLGACGVRFSHKIDNKPYDHKYIFNQLGFNLKPIEPQAAMGVEQLKRINKFTSIRRSNFKYFYKKAEKWSKYFILPKSPAKANPSWFAFPLTIKEDTGFDRQQIITYLESKMIQTRPLFAGNITRQPAYFHVNYRKVGKLENSDRILHNTFFLGIYPGIGKEEIDFMIESIDSFLNQI